MSINLADHRVNENTFPSTWNFIQMMNSRDEMLFFSILFFAIGAVTQRASPLVFEAKEPLTMVKYRSKDVHTAHCSSYFDWIRGEQLGASHGASAGKQLSRSSERADGDVVRAEEAQMSLGYPTDEVPATFTKPGFSKGGEK